MADQEKLKGTVKWFNPRKGYGFITDTQGKDHFVHFSNVVKGRTYVGFEDGDEVEFDLVPDGDKGMKCAEVVLTNEAKPVKKQPEKADKAE